MKAIYTITLLIFSNIFMTVAWYGHLKFQRDKIGSINLGLPLVILISWGIALFEYSFQVPANKIGFIDNGGPFNLWQLKIIQEPSRLLFLLFFRLFFLTNEVFRINHLIGFCFLLYWLSILFQKIDFPRTVKRVFVTLL